ncbi:MAG: imidazolonepropionase [Gemmatimonadales bacterium]|nr:imidazolonepropionase [Gemmatimonadales bacterium]
MADTLRTLAGIAEDLKAVDLVVENIGQLCTLDAPELDGQGPRRGNGMNVLGLVPDAMLLLGAGRVLATGTREEIRGELSRAGGLPATVKIIDAAGRAVIPGFVDPHTHTVFGKTRQDEYERRIQGETYLEIAAAGGGIHSSVADMRGRSEDELLELTTERLREMMAYGTTTVEIKSGYGLNLENEMKMLRVAGAAASAVGIRVVRTCLAAHELPVEYRGRRGDYIRLVTEEILPRVVSEGLAERCDVFCEPSVFDLEESRKILKCARDLGLSLTIHADELESFGGATLAARMRADSADHLIKIDEDGRSALAASRTVAVLLPGTVFSLGLRNYAPAREMIDQGCAVALATDFNPGSSPIRSLPLIQSIACTQMRMAPAESLVATTLNSAWALGLQKETGSLAPGKAADFLILDSKDFRLIPYFAGHNPVKRIFASGIEITA